MKQNKTASGTVKERVCIGNDPGLCSLSKTTADASRPVVSVSTEFYANTFNNNLPVQRPAEQTVPYKPITGARQKAENQNPTNGQTFAAVPDDLKQSEDQLARMQRCVCVCTEPSMIKLSCAPCVHPE